MTCTYTGVGDDRSMITTSKWSHYFIIINNKNKTSSSINYLIINYYYFIIIIHCYCWPYYLYMIDVECACVERDRVCALRSAVTSTQTV